MDATDIAKKMDSLEPGILDLPESLALAERAVLTMLADEASGDNSRLKAAELIFNKHQLGAPESRKAAASKEDIEHLRGIIGEVKEVLSSHVGFFERKYGIRGAEAGPSGTS